MDNKSGGLGPLVDLVESDAKFGVAIEAFELTQRIARELKRMREMAGMTQTEMAAALNISQGRVSQIESGLMEYAPNIEMIVRYASACGRTIEFDFVVRSGHKAAEAA